MKKLVLFSFLTLMGLSVLANSSALSFSAEQNNQTLLVYVNGKLIQNSRQKYVRHKSTPGFHVVKVKVFDSNGRFINTMTQRIYIKSGFENNYRVDVNANKKTFKKMPLYPLYSNFFYNPSLYTRNGMIA